MQSGSDHCPEQARLKYHLPWLDGPAAQHAVGVEILIYAMTFGTASGHISIHPGWTAQLYSTQNPEPWSSPTALWRVRQSMSSDSRAAVGRGEWGKNRRPPFSLA